MEISETSDGDVVILAPDGSLSSTAECAKLDRCLSDLLAKRHFLVALDLLHVPRISSAALRTLLLVQRRLESSRGALVLCRLSEPVVQVLALAGFDKDFSIVDGRREAVALALSRRASAPEPATAEQKESARSKARHNAAVARFAQRVAAALGGDGTGKSRKRGTGKHPSIKLIEALASRAARALEDRPAS